MRNAPTAVVVVLALLVTGCGLPGTGGGGDVQGPVQPTQPDRRVGRLRILDDAGQEITYAPIAANDEHKVLWLYAVPFDIQDPEWLVTDAEWSTSDPNAATVIPLPNGSASVLCFDELYVDRRTVVTITASYGGKTAHVNAHCRGGPEDVGRRVFTQSDDRNVSYQEFYPPEVLLVYLTSFTTGRRQADPLPDVIWQIYRGSGAASIEHLDDPPGALAVRCSGKRSERQIVLHTSAGGRNLLPLETYGICEY